MAVDARPPIFGTAIEGWRYVLAALSRMPVVLGVGMLIVFGLIEVKRWLLPDVESLFLQAETTGDFRQFFDVFQSRQIGSFLILIAQSFLLTPVVIATHRFVLLGEVAPLYSLRLSQLRFMRFFALSVVFQLLILIPSWLAWPISQASAALGLFGMLVVASAWIALMITGVVVCLRLLILFPAIAVDADGASWRNAIADTKGHTWRVFFIMLLTAIPAYVLFGTVPFLPSWPYGPNAIAQIALSAAQAAVRVLMVCALAAVASRLFAAFANKLNG